MVKFLVEGMEMSPRYDYDAVGRGYKTKYYKRKIAAAWRAEVRRQQADGSLGADLDEGDYAGFKITINKNGNNRRKLGFGGLIDYVETPTTFRVRFHGPFYD